MLLGERGFLKKQGLGGFAPNNPAIHPHPQGGRCHFTYREEELKWIKSNP